MKNKLLNILVIFGPLLFGCAETTDSQKPIEPAASGAQKFELRIPLQPIEELEIYSVPMFDSERMHVQIDATIHLAIGPGYPDKVTAKLPEELWTPCGSIQAEISKESMSGDSSHFSTTLHDQSIEILVLGEGSTTLEVRGVLQARADSTCGIMTGEIVQFTMQLQIQSHEVHGVVLGRPSHCRGAEFLFTAVSSSLGSGHIYDHFAPTLLDENGEPIHVQNARPNAQADVTLRGDLGIVENDEIALGEWVSPPNATVIDVEFEVGPATHILNRTGIVGDSFK